MNVTTKKLLLLALLLTSFSALCFLFQSAQMTSSLNENLRVNHVPSELLSYNKLGELFHELELINVIPNHSKRYKQAQYQDSTEPFQKRRQVGAALITADSEHHLSQQVKAYPEMESETISPFTISVLTEEENILGKDGILTNYDKHGKNWEKLAYFSFFMHKELIADGACGLRLHGGKSRAPSLPKHSYRVYFRKTYGQRDVDSTQFLPQTSPLRTLVIHTDIPEDWPLNNVIANEVYNRIGVDTLEYAPASFFLNGKSKGLYWLSPHLSKKYIHKRYQLKKIHFQRYKGNSRDKIYEQEIGTLAFGNTGNLSSQQANEKVYLDSLVNYFIAVAYSGNTDWNQGAGFKDLEDDDSRWEWIAWDLDHSFIDWYRSKVPVRPVFHQDGLQLIMSPKTAQVKSRRLRLLRRLLDEDPRFRKHFISRFIHVLNHEISEKVLLQIHDNYAQLLNSYERTINPLLLTFFKHRHTFIRNELRKHFDLAAFVKIRIEKGIISKTTINGTTVELPWEGHFPLGTTIKLTSGNGNEIYWLAENNKRHEERVAFIVNTQMSLNPQKNLPFPTTK